MRLLLERVTQWAAALQKRENTGDEPLRIVFASRGGHDYNHFFNYIDKLAMQSDTNTLYLKGKGLAPHLLNRKFWSVLPAEKWAGLQLEDTVASAFYQAANSASPSWDLEPAKALAPVVEGRANVGVTVFPLPAQAPIPESARAIFRHYGYGW